MEKSRIFGYISNFLEYNDTTSLMEFKRELVYIADDVVEVMHDFLSFMYHSTNVLTDEEYRDKIEMLINILDGCDRW